MKKNVETSDVGIDSKTINEFRTLCRNRNSTTATIRIASPRSLFTS